MAPSRIYLLTLGCPKNEADSGVIARRLAAAGAPLVDEPDLATHILINTCGFTREAKEESIAAILEATRAYPAAEVMVLGCLVERYREELSAGIPEVSRWFGLADVVDLLAVVGPGDQAPPLGGSVIGAAAVPAAVTPGPSVRGGAPPVPVQGVQRSYAYIKISDGCDNLCSFCAIPGIKGPYAALSLRAVEEQVEAALAAGARELVLVGQDTTIWAEGDLDLNGLVERLAADPRVTWIRLMYFQPEHVGDRLVRLVAEHPAVVRYLDIPFQHGSALVLARMARRGGAAAYLELLDRARRLMPDVSLRSTFIVGFPGETEEEFDELLDFAETAAFDHAGVFLYSPEEGTPAFALRPRVPVRVGRERLGRLSAILASSTERANRALVGCAVEVMIDSVGVEHDLGGVAAVGRTYRQAPEVDGVTFLQGPLPPGTVSGRLVRAVVTEAVGSDLVAWCETTEPS